jgi:hypothetical protein
MYCLLDNNYIVAGPYEWNARRFSVELLEEYGISHNLPVIPNNEPFIINETLQILPVVAIVHDEYNIKTQQLIGPYPIIDELGLSLTYTVIDRDIDAVKLELKHNVATNRYNHEVSGVNVNINDVEYTVPTDRESRNVILQSLALGVADKSWKFGEQWVVLDSDNLRLVVDSILNHVQAAFDREQSLIETINSIDELDELALLDITVQ